MKFSPSWPSLFVAENGDLYHYGTRKLHLSISGCGYYMVRIPGSRQIRAHRAVADAYLHRMPGETQVNHKNGVKLDNRIENLEWCTPRHNIIHAVRTNLTPRNYSDEAVADMRKDYAAGGSVVNIMAAYDISRTCLYNILNGRTYCHIVNHSDDIARTMARRRARPRHKLTEGQVARIKSMLLHGLTRARIASEMNVSPGLISQIAIGKVWRTVNAQ